MSKIDPHKLLISSDFYTIQGEGISSGIPAYFVRLGICNLTCGMSRAFTNMLAKEAKLEDGEIFEGDLVKEGKATWTCDSTSQWLWRGEDKEFQYLLDRFKEEGVYDDILDGNVHIIWTGGEPTIKGHQEAINNFFDYWIKQDVRASYVGGIFNEIETNGTNYIEDELFDALDQINCSPKLANSGMTAKQRIVPKAIERIMQHPNYQFKFVISTEDDVLELFRDFVEPFNIPLKNVVCMPGLDDASNFEERTRFVMEMAKKYRFRGLTRLHIAAWDKTLNV
jgi:organic radical activating enzyme